MFRTLFGGARDTPKPTTVTTIHGGYFFTDKDDIDFVWQQGDISPDFIRQLGRKFPNRRLEATHDPFNSVGTSYVALEIPDDCYKDPEYKIVTAMCLNGQNELTPFATFVGANVGTFLVFYSVNCCTSSLYNAWVYDPETKRSHTISFGEARDKTITGPNGQPVPVSGLFGNVTIELPENDATWFHHLNRHITGQEKSCSQSHGFGAAYKG